MDLTRCSRKGQVMTEETPLLMALEMWIPVPGAMLLDVPDEYAEEVEAALRDQGIVPDRGVQYSWDPATVGLILQGAGAVGAVLGGLAAALRVLLRRHDGKRVTVPTPDGPLEIQGFSDDQVEKVLREAAAYSRERYAEWRAAAGLDDDTEESQ